MLGATSGSPFYLIKTQMQAQAASQIAVGYQHKHTTMNKALVEIYRSDGVKGKIYIKTSWHNCIIHIFY